MPPKGHRRSTRERVQREVANAQKGPEKKAPAKRAKPRGLTAKSSGNPIVDVLDNPTPGRIAALLASADSGQLTRDQVRGAITSELGRIATAMLSPAGLSTSARLGFSVRRDLLTKLLDTLEEGGSGSAVVHVTVVFPERFYGPPHGDKLSTGKGAT